MATRAKSKKKASKKRSGRAKAQSQSRAVATAYSHYKLLGVPPTADTETIRARYLSLVREYPPETQPEAFQALRQAYDVLQDPARRGQYDRERFHGTTVAKLQNRIKWLESEDRAQEAIELLEKLVDIAGTPTNWLHLARTCEDFGWDEKAQRAYAAALATTQTEHDAVAVLVAQAHGQPTQSDIIQGLLAVAKTYPNTAPRQIAADLFAQYLSVGEPRKGHAFFRKLISRKKVLTAADFSVYLEWLDTLRHFRLIKDYEKLLETKVKPAADQAATWPTQDAIKAVIRDRLEMELSDDDLTSKIMLADLWRRIDPRDERARSTWRQYAEALVRESQVARMVNDLTVPTTMVKKVLQWYSEEYDGTISLGGDADLETRPTLLMTLSEAKAIAYIQTTYPRLYPAVANLVKPKAKPRAKRRLNW